MSRRAVYVVPASDGFLIMGKRTGLSRRRAWSRRYDVIDALMGRPIHVFMSVAPPWAKRLRRRTPGGDS